MGWRNNFIYAVLNMKKPNDKVTQIILSSTNLHDGNIAFKNKYKGTIINVKNNNKNN